MPGNQAFPKILKTSRHFLGVLKFLFLLVKKKKIELNKSFVWLRNFYRITYPFFNEL